MKTITLITEDISEPIDEGIKKYSFKLAEYISNNLNYKIFTRVINNNIKHQYKLPKNKLILSLSFITVLKKDKGVILYVPNSSSTFFSFIRLKILQLFTGRPTALISLQKREHAKWQKFIIRLLLRPKMIFVFSEREKHYYLSLGINTIVTSAGVDTDKFIPIDTKTKIDLRKKINLPIESKIILHVGHINEGRNLSILTELIKENFVVLVIGSTCFTEDEKLKKDLKNDGILIVNEYIQNINEYYQASDAYVFPVLNDSSVIEFPLSILEAMACNIPILSTHFGSIPNHFKESGHFKYFADKESLLRQANELFNNSDISKSNNSTIILNKYGWEKQFQELMSNINTL